MRIFDRKGGAGSGWIFTDFGKTRLKAKGVGQDPLHHREALRKGKEGLLKRRGKRKA